MSHNFCAEPWKQIFIGPDSKVKTCCAGRKDLGDLKEKNIDEILKDTPLREIKESILKGEWHQNCGLCKELEDKGVRSQRIRSEHEVSNIEFYRNNIDFHTPEVLDVRWSNTCNLACNYCMPYFSSVWASIKKTYQTPPRNYDSVISYVKNNREKVNNVWLLGGEPFLQKDNLELLEVLPDNVGVSVISNLSSDIEDNPIFHILKNKSIEKKGWVGICPSFETIGKRYEYVRHNASWEKFCYNLELMKKYFHGRVTAFPLYCLYSAFNLEEFYDFIVEHRLSVQWQKIEGPWQLNVSLLPENLRKKAIEEIDKVYDKYYDPSNPVCSLNPYPGNIDTPGLDLGSLLNIKESLLVPGTLDYRNTETSNVDIHDYHTDLETNLHQKKYTFKELWGDIFPL